MNAVSVVICEAKMQDKTLLHFCIRLEQIIGQIFHAQMLYKVYTALLRKTLMQQLWPVLKQKCSIEYCCNRQ